MSLLCAGERVTLALELLKRELVATGLMAQIQSEVEADYQKNQRKYMLTEQLKKIKKELGLEVASKHVLCIGRCHTDKGLVTHSRRS